MKPLLKQITSFTMALKRGVVLRIFIPMGFSNTNVGAHWLDIKPVAFLLLQLVPKRLRLLT